MKNTVLFCFMLSMIINLTSYFFYSEYLFWLSLFLIIPLVIFAFYTLLSEKSKFAQWPEREKTILYIVVIICFLTFTYFLNVVGGYRVDKIHSGYALQYRTSYIRDATKVEYDLYMSWSARMITGFLSVFFYAFFANIKNK